MHGASQHPDPPRGVSDGKRPHNGIACARTFPLSKIGALVASVMYWKNGWARVCLEVSQLALFESWFT